VDEGRSDHGSAFTRKIMEAEKEKEDRITREARLGEAISKITLDDEELLKRLSE
jgi:hypothetical protein